MKGLSPKAQRLLTEYAQNEGRNSGLTELLPEHVILAMLKSADGMGFGGFGNEGETLVQRVCGHGASSSCRNP